MQMRDKNAMNYLMMVLGVKTWNGKASTGHIRRSVSFERVWIAIWDYIRETSDDV